MEVIGPDQSGTVTLGGRHTGEPGGGVAEAGGGGLGHSAL